MKRDRMDSTAVVPMGIENFTTSNFTTSNSREDLFKAVDTSRVSDTDATSMADEKHKNSCKADKKSGRFRKFVKKHFLPRKGGPTNVKEIHIVPDGDDLKWARRSAGSAASRSSDSTGSSEDDRLEVVHDMAEELGNDL